MNGLAEVAGWRGTRPSVRPHPTRPSRAADAPLSCRQGGCTTNDSGNRHADLNEADMPICAGSTGLVDDVLGGMFCARRGRSRRGAVRSGRLPVRHVLPPWMRQRDANPIAQCQIAIVRWQEHRNVRGGLMKKVPAVQVAREDGGADPRPVDAGVALAWFHAGLGAPVLMRDPCRSGDVVSRHYEPIRALGRPRPEGDEHEPVVTLRSLLSREVQAPVRPGRVARRLDLYFDEPRGRRVHGHDVGVFEASRVSAAPQPCRAMTEQAQGSPADFTNFVSATA
jgi:hypothetical protein